MVPYQHPIAGVAAGAMGLASAAHLNRRPERRVKGVFGVYDHLSDLAQRLGRYMAENNPKGLTTHFDDDLLKAFPDENRKSLGLALAELEADRFVALHHVLGPHLPRVGTTVQLLIASDPAITGHDPVVLARMLLEKPDLGGRASDLEAAAGWERRRFNPAFALLIPCVHDGRVRKTLQDDYPTKGILLVDEDLIDLRRYVQRHTR